MTITNRNDLENKYLLQENKVITDIRNYFGKVQDLLDRLYDENEVLADRFIENTLGFLELKEHYEKQFDVFEKNNKIFQKQLRDFDTMMSFCWKAESVGLDTKSDVVKFTATEKMKYIQDYKIKLDQKLLESGRKIQTLTMIRTDGKKTTIKLDEKEKTNVKK